MLIFFIVYGIGAIASFSLLAALVTDLESSERLPYLFGAFGLSWIWPVLAVWILGVQISLWLDKVDRD